MRLEECLWVGCAIGHAWLAMGMGTCRDWARDVPTRVGMSWGMDNASDSCRDMSHTCPHADDTPVGTGSLGATSRCPEALGVHSAAQWAGWPYKGGQMGMERGWAVSMESRQAASMADGTRVNGVQLNAIEHMLFRLLC